MSPERHCSCSSAWKTKRLASCGLFQLELFYHWRSARITFKDRSGRKMKADIHLCGLTWSFKVPFLTYLFNSKQKKYIICEHKASLEIRGENVERLMKKRDWTGSLSGSGWSEVMELASRGGNRWQLHMEDLLLWKHISTLLLFKTSSPDSRGRRLWLATVKPSSTFAWECSSSEAAARLLAGLRRGDVCLKECLGFRQRPGEHRCPLRGRRVGAHPAPRGCLITGWTKRRTQSRELQGSCSNSINLYSIVCSFVCNQILYEGGGGLSWVSLTKSH